MAAPQQTSPNQASAPPSAAGQLKDPPPSVMTEEVVVAPAMKDPPVTDDADVTTETQAEPTPTDTTDEATSTAPTAATAPEVTYESTEASDTYLLAKRLLADGDFENALQTIGVGLQELTATVKDDVHPALAPLYYLYGTTLLYSIEESSDMQAPTTQDEDDADDIQIAWENLETARLILTKLMETCNKQKLSLDLAQIHLRLGDLQRANGHNMEAVQDYHYCLELRQPILGPYERKVADTHFQLGLVYMLLASESATPPEGGGAATTPPTPVNPALVAEYRSKALVHYLEAAKSFAGQIAFLCGENPEEVVAVKVLKEGKSTGLEEKDQDATAISATLKAIRAKVAHVTASSANDVQEISDFVQLLDEIQETVDEAENAKIAMGEVSALKAQAQAAAAGEGEVNNGDGSTTCIGFAAAASNPWANSSSSASTAAPVQMLQVRKKKKRSGEESEDSKIPAKKVKASEE